MRPQSSRIAALAVALLSISSVEGLSVKSRSLADTSAANGTPLMTRETTMCGRDSPGGSTKCAMNLCCSTAGWCGTSEAHCLPDNGCQAGFGACAIIRPKTCGENSGTVNKRTVGYYQGNNVRNRKCNAVPVSAIKTAGYTHLYFAFVSINPSTFKTQTFEAADEQTMRDFSALKKAGSLQTWVAVGGGDFSLPGSSTFTTWSTMAASSANRAAFIASAKSFMSQYGFQGMDLDWEFPGLEERGGRAVDLTNFVTLVKEMRASFGTTYGISLAMPADYGSMMYMDIKGLEPYVDSIGFMSYDLHGYSANFPNVGGQTDVRELYDLSFPLAYAGVDMSKVNFGLALYGRGYTLSNPSCNTIGCAAKGKSNGGPCTNDPGFMSLGEIPTLINQGYTSRLNRDSMMKELIKGDQWIGYDDAETFDLKKKFANNLCFGGTMTWAVDYVV